MTAQYVIDALKSNRKLPGFTITQPGTYTLEGSAKLLGPIIVLADNVTLLGRSSDRKKTILWGTFTAASAVAAVMAASGQSAGLVPDAGLIDVRGNATGTQRTTLASACAPDDTLLHFTDASWLTTFPQQLRLRQPNDSAFFETALGVTAGTGYNTASHTGTNKPYIRDTVVYAISKSGNDVTIAAPVGHSLAGGGVTEVREVTPIKNFVMKNITTAFFPGALRGVPDPSDYANNYPLHAVNALSLTGCYNPTIHNFHAICSGKNAIATEGVYGGEIGNPSGAADDIFADGAWNLGDSGHGYLQYSRCHHTRGHNHKLRRMRHLTFQWGCTDIIVDGVDTDCDVNFHGGGCGGQEDLDDDKDTSIRVKNATISLRDGHTPGYGDVSRTPASATFAPPDYKYATRCYSDNGSTEIDSETPAGTFNSILLDGDAYLTMSDSDFGSYDRSKFKLAMGLLQGAVGATRRLWMKGSALSATEFAVNMTSTDKIQVNLYSAANTLDCSVITTAAFSSLVAPYCIEIEVDVANAVAADRIIIRVNGVRQTLAGSSTFPTGVPVYTNTTAISIGAESDGGSPVTGKIKWPQFYSGVIAPSSSIYSGGVMLDPTANAGLKSLIKTDIADDDILATTWTANGGAAESEVTFL